MSRAIGVDPGTMFFQTAEIKGDSEISFQEIRNAFVELDVTDEASEALSQNNWKYIHDEAENKYYVLGEDALKMAKMFPGKLELRRPMKDGVLNKGESKKMLILSDIIERSLGKPSGDLDVVTTCVSSASVDGSSDSAFHRSRLQGMFSNAGWDVRVIEEAHAVILSENPTMQEEDGTESKYSGMGISFGAGRVNCVLAYKGKSVIGMSAARSGDWIDTKVEDATDEPISQIIGAKEKKLDFNKLDYEDDVIIALDVYYGEMIKFIFNQFAAKFKEVKSEFPGAIEIVIAGGTSMPKGFIAKVEQVIASLSLPFEIKEIRRAKDPRTCVARGCMTHAIISQRKKAKDFENEKKKPVKKEVNNDKQEKVSLADAQKNIDDLEGLA